MLRLERLAPLSTTDLATGTLTLRFAERCRSRLRAMLDDGREAGLFLPRGTVLHGGDALEAVGGEILRVVAAAEDLYEVTASNTTGRSDVSAWSSASGICDGRSTRMPRSPSESAYEA